MLFKDAGLSTCRLPVVEGGATVMVPSVHDLTVKGVPLRVTEP